jgi:osmotically inducible protein OsmC
VPRIERTAEAVWEGNVARGSGTLTGRSSGAFSELPFRLATRIGSPEGETSPEELIAAAHAGCYAMSLASELAKAGNSPERLEVAATCVMDEVGDRHLVVASQLEVSARVAGLEDEAFQAAVEAADEGCPISHLIRASAEIRISASLH